MIDHGNGIISIIPGVERSAEQPDEQVPDAAHGEIRGYPLQALEDDACEPCPQRGEGSKGRTVDEAR